MVVKGKIVEVEFWVDFFASCRCLRVSHSPDVDDGGLVGGEEGLLGIFFIFFCIFC